MSKTYARCPRCRKFASLALVTVYVPPGTIKTARLCDNCERIVKGIGRGLKNLITKGTSNAGPDKSNVQSTESAV